MKKKICSWLDSNINGGIVIRNNRVYACCVRSVPLLVDKDYDYRTLNFEQIQSKRN